MGKAKNLAILMRLLHFLQCVVPSHQILTYSGFISREKVFTNDLYLPSNLKKFSSYN